MAGSSGFHPDRGEDIPFREGFATISAFTSTRGERRYRAGARVRQLRIRAERPWLESQFGPDCAALLFEGTGIRQPGHGPVSDYGLVCALKFPEGPRGEGIGRVFLKGQALAALAAELAKRVGTNPCTLQKLLRHFFGKTPYALVLDTRMAVAHRLLAAEGRLVAEAAEAVGYGHAGNFSAAFSRYFSMPPRRVARRAVP